jgi:hypothetical protein
MVLVQVESLWPVLQRPVMVITGALLATATFSALALSVELALDWFAAAPAFAGLADDFCGAGVALVVPCEAGALWEKEAAVKTNKMNDEEPIFTVHFSLIWDE